MQSTHQHDHQVTARGSTGRIVTSVGPDVNRDPEDGWARSTRTAVLAQLVAAIEIQRRSHTRVHAIGIAELLLRCDKVSAECGNSQENHRYGKQAYPIHFAASMTVRVYHTINHLFLISESRSVVAQCIVDHFLQLGRSNCASGHRSPYDYGRCSFDSEPLALLDIALHGVPVLGGRNTRQESRRLKAYQTSNGIPSLRFDEIWPLEELVMECFKRILVCCTLGSISGGECVQMLDEWEMVINNGDIGGMALPQRIQSKTHLPAEWALEV